MTEAEARKLQENVKRGSLKSTPLSPNFAPIKKTRKAPTHSKEKEHMEWVLKQSELPYVSEHKFWEGRRFRFDWAIPQLKLAFEYEGVYGGKSRHTTVSGYSKDSEKYNEAAILGWKVLRYTASTYKNFQGDLNRLLSVSC